MKVHVIRLEPGDDLKLGIEKFVGEAGILAGFIITCVGSLSTARMRMAGASAKKQDIRRFEQDYEIVSLVGTVSVNGSHLHISISDENGHLLGGHLKEGSLVHTTAEIVIGQEESLRFNRVLDARTGFPELSVESRQYP